MVITLTREQTEWLEARVASGDFASVEDGVRRSLDQFMAETTLGEDNLDWAKPLVDEALASVARGEVISLDDHQKHTAALLARLGG